MSRNKHINLNMLSTAVWFVWSEHKEYKSKDPSLAHTKTGKGM